MSAYDRVVWRGYTFDKVTVQALQEAEKRLGYTLSIIQGSFNTSVSASGGTHAGGGAVDLAPADYANKVHVLRAIGFAAWHRPAIRGLWVEHVHAVLLDDAVASAAAKAQWTDYRNHRDGLADNAYDPTWHPNPIPIFHYKVLPTLGVSASKLATDFHLVSAGRKNSPTLRGTAIQKQLNKKINAHLSVDGVIGPMTLAAWKRYEHHLVQTHGAKKASVAGVPNKWSLRRLFAGSIYFVVK